MGKNKNGNANKANGNTETKDKKTAYKGYDLKQDAIERLVNAEKKSYTNTKIDPGKAYRSSVLDKIPSWIKAVFIKFWFSGAVCFFILWGLGIYVTNLIDMIFILGVVLGMVNDILVNNIFRFYERYPGQNSKWMMFPQKKFWTFIANIVYSTIVLAGVVWFYEITNAIANTVNGTQEQIYLGVEPILFGLCYLAIDMMFVGMKNLMITIVSDAKKKN